jgi:hypothetical protein
VQRAIESYFQHSENIELAISKAPKPSSSAASAVVGGGGVIPMALPVASAVPAFQPQPAPASASASASARPIAMAIPSAGGGNSYAAPYAIPVPSPAPASASASAAGYGYPSLKPGAFSAGVAVGSAVAASAATKTQLSILLPDNTRLSKEFRAEDTLWTVYEFIALNAQKWAAQAWTLQVPIRSHLFFVAVCTCAPSNSCHSLRPRTRSQSTSPTMCWIKR